MLTHRTHRAHSTSSLDEDDFSFLPPIPWGLLAGVMLSLFLYLPLTRALGLVGFDWGARAFAAHPWFALLVRAAATLALVQLACSWPLSALVAPELLERRRAGFGGFMGIAIALFAPPLVAFVSLFARYTGVTDAYELMILVGPALVLALVVYLKSQRTSLFTGTLFLLLFIPLFLVNDVLSPFSTLVSYHSRGPAFYWWRAASVAVAFSLCLTSPIAGRFTARFFRREAAWVVLAIAGSVIVLRGLFPIGMAFKDGAPVGSYLTFEAWWLGLLPMLLFFVWPGRASFWVLIGASAATSLAALVAMGMTAASGDASVWGLLAFSQALVAAVLLAHLAVSLFRPAWRAARG